LAGCSGAGPVAVHVSSRVQSGLAQATVPVAHISLSEDGQSWTDLLAQPVDLSLTAGSYTELVLSQLPVGEYHGLRVDLGPGYAYEDDAGNTVETDYPDVLAYIQGGIYRWSSADNGYPTTQEYFEFTTRNEGLDSPVQIDPQETSFLVLTLQPMLRPEGSMLAARVAYTSFVE